MEEEMKEEMLAQPLIVETIQKSLNLGSTFLRGRGLLNIPDILLKYKMLIICFGASWCIITQDFVKHLAAYYDEINIEEKELEIIFVSLEKTEEDFKRFTEGMPWLVLPFNDVRTGDLKEFYKIRSLPQVIVLQPNGEAIVTNGRQDVYEGGEGTFKKWVGLKAQV